MAKDAQSNPIYGRRGMILGKFMPPHRGHQMAIDAARRMVDDLTVLLCSLTGDPIPGELREDWLRELFPGCRVVHCRELLPQTPKEHPEFWPIWRDVCERYCGPHIDFVFASEDYGERLAAELDARFIPIDLHRQMAPISGTQVRADPMRHWDWIVEPARPFFVKRVCLFGPESTGKTTLARDLAKHYGTVWVPEFARGLLDRKAGRCDYDDLEWIARGQTALEDAAARHAKRLLFCDTDPLTTTIWADVLFGRVPESVAAAAERTYDLYLLCDIDVPWVDDEQRYLPDQRRAFRDHCVYALEHRGRRYTIIRGDWADRRAKAIEVVGDLLAERTPISNRQNQPLQ